MNVEPNSPIQCALRQTLCVFQIVLASVIFLAHFSSEAHAWNEFGGDDDDEEEVSDNAYEYESREDRLERLERLAKQPLGKIEIDLKRPEDVVIDTVADNPVLVFGAIFLIFSSVGAVIYLGGRSYLRPPPKMPRPERRPRDPQARRTRISNSTTSSIPLASYSVLGLEATASDDEIRARYKHLVKSFHSDKLASSGLPAEVLALTEEQFRKIQSAYDTIRASRGMQ